MHKNILQLCLLFKKNGAARGEFLRKKGTFGSMGKFVIWRPYLIPSEPNLVFLGNNVHIAANVRFITHDMFHLMINYKHNLKDDMTLDKYTGSIHIGDNVTVGANVTILYGVTLSGDSIVAAGSVVTKSFPRGVIIGGNPARIIGSYSDFEQRRLSTRKK